MVRPADVRRNLRKEERNKWGYFKAFSLKGETVYAVVPSSLQADSAVRLDLYND
jgi:hypothetical protein